MIEDSWYFETMIWEWDGKKPDRGPIVEMGDSGINENMAIENHCLWVRKMNDLINSSKD